VEENMQFELTSTAIQEGEPIPREYTADGANQSPPLKWNEPPRGAASFALVCEDPDAPRQTFTHWVAFNLPAESRELSADVSAEPTLANGTAQGSNDFGGLGYGGPSPPPGKPHRYVFRLFALDAALRLQPGCSRQSLLAATEGHVLAEARLTGIYGRN
jgi:Raf kinase inhibitor-like YbhB/YbcL family protein